MSITNEDRYHLQERANEVLGKKEGTILMELLPPVGWTDVATKNDLDAQTALLGAQIALLRSDLDARTALLRSDMDGKIALLRSDLGAQSSVLQSDLGAQSSVLQSNFRADLQSGLNQLQSKMVTAILTLTGILVTMAGLQVAVLLRT